MPPNLRAFSLLNRPQRRSYLPPVATYPSIGWLLAGLLIPVSVFFLFSFWETGVFTLIRTWSLDQYREVVTDDLYYGLILRTLLLGLTVSAVVLPVAYLGAYVLRFIISRGRRVILFLIVASALASYLVRIYAWKAILTPAGILNSALDSLGLISEPLTLLGRPGVIIALTHILVPIAMLPIAGAMESVNPDLIRAGRDLGAGPVETFLRVTLPLTARGVLTAFVLTFVLSVGDYVTPQLVGGKGSLMIGRVIFDQFGITGNYALASALSFSLIVAAAAFIVGVLLCVRLFRGGARRLGAFATAARARRFHPAWPVWVRRLPWGHAYLLLLLLFLWVPLILVLILSFNQLPIASLPITGWTLDWYREIFTDQTIRGGFGTSLKVAGLVVAIGLAIGLPTAFAVTRRTFVTKPALMGAVVLPIALPGVVVGFSILAMFRFLEWIPSMRSIVLGQVTLVLPFVVLIVMAALQNFNRNIEEAARDLGCTYWGALRRVTLRILLPIIAGTALIVFAISMDEFVVTNFIVGTDPTLPPVIWSIMNRRGIPPTVNAVASILMVVPLIAAVVYMTLTRRTQRRPDAVTGRARGKEGVDRSLPFS